jgi:two-component system nitrate/nitrite response regulator NarL
MKGIPLSTREAAIARLVAKGWSNRQIADHHDLLEQSVKNALSNVYRKLGIDNRVQLTLLVTRGKLGRHHNGGSRRRGK